MDKQQITRRENLGAKNLNPDVVSDVANIFDELESKADIKERDLVYFLDVADKTLRNWKVANSAESQSSKVLRLHRLKEVVDAAILHSISKSQIRQLLTAPLDIRDKDQRSIVDVIKSEPDSQFFSQMVSMLIENFRSRNGSNGHYVLNDDDFERIVNDLESDREPTEAVKRARKNFLSLKGKAR